MVQPLIALTTYPPNDRQAVELPETYVSSVRRAGGRALLIPPGEPDIDGLLDAVDGVVLTGGGDLDPSCYGAPGHETIYKLDAARDRTELALAAAIVKRWTPTLAICRGQQILNVALGGTLHTHLPDVVGHSVPHRVMPDDPTPRVGSPADPVLHPVDLEPGSLVAEIMQATTVTPMSWHHQAIAELGRDLHAVGWAADGTIEALRHDHHPWLAAVQWHPELTAAEDVTQQRLFDGLVAAARSIGSGSASRGEMSV